MLYNLGGAIKTGLGKFRDFYVNNKKQIYSTLFMLSLHPHYKKFIFKKEENSNKIDNFLTYEEAKERQESVSNINYKVFLDFSHQENKEETNLFKVTGKVLVSFDFDLEKFPQSKKYFKLDYQGKVISIHLGGKRLKEKEDFYVNDKETKENFVRQEKNCVFIAKDILSNKNNRLLIEFCSEYSREFRSKEINNPFLLMQQHDVTMNKKQQQVKKFLTYNHLICPIFK